MTEHQTKFIAKFPVTSQSKRRSTKQNHCKLPVTSQRKRRPAAVRSQRKTTEDQVKSIAKSPVTSQRKRLSTKATPLQSHQSLLTQLSNEQLASQKLNPSGGGVVVEKPWEGGISSSLSTAKRIWLLFFFSCFNWSHSSRAPVSPFMPTELQELGLRPTKTASIQQLIVSQTKNSCTLSSAA